MKKKVILIQGAMDIEIEYLIRKLYNPLRRCVEGYDFYEGTINNVRVVISKTLIGTINATIATMIGIVHFNPDIIINQGISGSHKEYLHIGDIIIGEKCCNINSYSMPPKDIGQGSLPLEWEPDARAKDTKYAILHLVNITEKLLKNRTDKYVFKGTLGSGDAFNREADRILWITNKFDTMCEDMESIGVYSVCDVFEVPCIGIRIISNNEITLEKFDESVAIKLQELLVDILEQIESGFDLWMI